MDDIRSLMLEIEKETYRVFNTKVREEVKEILHEESEYIYTEYVPSSDKVSRYRQGLMGGYGDENNIEVDVDIRATGNMTMKVTNETMGYKQDVYLDAIIESGKGYNWTDDVPPRPAFERAFERLVMEEVVENALKSGLKTKGIEIE